MTEVMGPASLPGGEAAAGKQERAGSVPVSPLLPLGLWEHLAAAEVGAPWPLWVLCGRFSDPSCVLGGGAAEAWEGVVLGRDPSPSQHGLMDQGFPQGLPAPTPPLASAGVVHVLKGPVSPIWDSPPAASVPGDFGIVLFILVQNKF